MSPWRCTCAGMCETAHFGSIRQSDLPGLFLRRTFGQSILQKSSATPLSVPIFGLACGRRWRSPTTQYRHNFGCDLRAWRASTYDRASGLRYVDCTTHMGSVAEAVMRKAKCTVLTVKAAKVGSARDNSTASRTSASSSASLENHETAELVSKGVPR
jgi:hypothetical protein